MRRGHVLSVGSKLLRRRWQGHLTRTLQATELSPRPLWTLSRPSASKQTPASLVYENTRGVGTSTTGPDASVTPATRPSSSSGPVNAEQTTSDTSNAPEVLAGTATGWGNDTLVPVMAKSPSIVLVTDPSSSSKEERRRARKAERQRKKRAAQRAEAEIKRKATVAEAGRLKPEELVANDTASATGPSRRSKREKVSTISDNPLVDMAGLLGPFKPGSHPLIKLRDREPHAPVPRLAHGLDRVLFNPGVYWTQDPRSGVYNFPPQVQSIPPIQSFDFEKVKGFVPSFGDPVLSALAAKHSKRFVGSTSSLTFLLAHIYHLISRHRKIDTSSFASTYTSQNKNFTSGMTSPGTISIKYDPQSNVYSYNGGDGTDEYGLANRNVLVWMGTMLEKFLTLPTTAFNKLLKSAVMAKETEPEAPMREAYQYSFSKRFLMRAQLDCRDKRLPGTGVFDIKTRASIAVRHDRLNWKNASGYQIKTLQGRYESFERELYDLTRSAMIKYNFQARIGHMDGIFIAYHNTAKIFGFQYLNITEMDQYLFGGRTAGDRYFSACVSILEVLAQSIASHQKKKDVTCVFETDGPHLRVWLNEVVEPGQRSTKPITELTLAIENVVNNEVVEGPPQIDEEKNEWVIRYTVRKGNSGADPDVLTRYNQALETQARVQQLTLPPGVDPDDADALGAMWEDVDLDLTPDRGETLQPPQPSKLKGLFRPTNPFIETLRSLMGQGNSGQAK